MPQVGEETKLDVGPRMVDTGSATGAGDGLRTRYLNLGNKVFRDHIQARGAPSFVCFIQLYSDRVEFLLTEATVGYGECSWPCESTHLWPTKVPPLRRVQTSLVRFPR